MERETIRAGQGGGRNASCRSLEERGAGCAGGEQRGQDGDGGRGRGVGGEVGEAAGLAGERGPPPTEPHRLLWGLRLLFSEKWGVVAGVSAEDPVILRS